MRELDFAALVLAKGGHNSWETGACLLEASRAALVLRSDGVPKAGTPPFARLWGRCTLNAASGCWEFTGRLNADGYGSLRFADRMEKAHRVAWWLTHGHPGDLHVCHQRDNPPCCNPAHLFLGTNRDNMIDRQSKGRTKNLDLGRAVLAVKAAAVTHCPQGHPYAGDNVRYRQNGARRCAACYRNRDRARRARKVISNGA